jgi:hypothetical protein
MGWLALAQAQATRRNSERHFTSVGIRYHYSQLLLTPTPAAIHFTYISVSGFTGIRAAASAFIFQ